MKHKLAAVAAFAVMLGAALYLLVLGSIFAHSPLGAGIQVAAMAVVVWARIRLGSRSFCATPLPLRNEERIVTSGPYAVVRHPIYTAACIFIWTGIVEHLSVLTICLGLTVSIAAAIRAICEEKTLIKHPAYGDYAKKTFRMVPYVF